MHGYRSHILLLKRHKAENALFAACCGNDLHQAVRSRLPALTYLIEKLRAKASKEACNSKDVEVLINSGENNKIRLCSAMFLR
jgi:hypothetical protein